MQPILMQTLRWTLAGMLFLLVMEVCARTDDRIKWQAPFWGTYSRGELSVVDELGYRNRPDSRFEKWTINRHGFRGPDVSMQKPEGKIRIMVLGASETFGLYEQAGMEYPAQLQQELDQMRPGRYEVINAAVPGISPPRLLHLYEHWLRKFETDIAIYYPSPSIYLLRRPPGPIVLDRIRKVRPKAFESRLMAKTRIAVKGFLPAGLQTKMRQVVIARAERAHGPDWVFKEPPPDRPPLFHRQLTTLVDALQRDGAQIFLVTHATRITNTISEEERQLLIGWRKLYPHVAETCFLEMETIGNDIIRKVAREAQARLIDIDAKIPKTNDIFADHVHFTTKGAAHMARLLADHIVRPES